MKKIALTTTIITLMLVFEAYSQPPTVAFFSKLQSLCGEKFVGSMTFPIDGQDSFKGKVLVAEFARCSDDEIQIPFMVGKDESRTWIVSKTSLGLRLKHKHLLEDGSVDPISDYGGDTFSAGTPLSQSFPADAHTKQLIPEAATNVWMMSLSDDLTTLTYHLERHNKKRFTAVLERQL